MLPKLLAEPPRAPRGAGADIHGAVPLLHDYLGAAAARSPFKTALVADGRRYSYGQLAHWSASLAAFLASAGVTRGERVMVYAENGPEPIVAFFATLAAGGVASIVSPLTRADKLAWLVNHSGAVALVTDGHDPRAVARVIESCPALRAAVVAGAPELAPPPGWGGRLTSWDAALAEGERLPEPTPRTIDVDLASIVYTSGSTGEPKGVMLTHRNMLTAASSISSYLGLREDDVVLDVLPLAFDYGLYQMLLAARAGATLVLERNFAFMSATLRRVVDEGVTVFPGVPTVFSMMQALRSLDSFDLTRVRIVTNTAAALSARNIDFLRRAFPAARIFSMYGQTECKRISYLPPEDLARKPGSVGLPIPNTEFWLIDEHGRRLGPGQIGELVVRGATVMRGYWNDAQRTAKRLRPGPLPGEQVLHTGDLCRLDEEGYLYFVGRMDDIIKSRGEKIAPREVEAVLQALPGVTDAVVVGVPDEVLGEAVQAFIVPEEGVELDVKDVLAHCSAKLEAFMVPRHVVIIAELPRTANGKVDRAALR